MSTLGLPGTILVPTDFSVGAGHALDYAVALAAKLGARIHVLHVVTLPAYGVDVTGVASSNVIAELSEGGERALAALIAAHARDAFAPPLLRIGDAREVIDAVAREIGADLVVMGTHGRRGLTRLLLGSVAEAVVRTAPCSVLAVRAPA